MSEHQINNERDLYILFSDLKHERFPYTLTYDPMVKRRTLKQNSSINIYCRIMAEKLNDAGLDMRKVLKPEYEIPWTLDSFRENMFNVISRAMFNKTSSQLETTEPSEVHKVLDKNLSEKFNVSHDFPNNRG